MIQLKRLGALMTSLMTTLPMMAHASLAPGEPKFCEPTTFSKFERGNNVPYIERIHVYQIGKLTLAGLAVGNSDHRYVQQLAKQYTNLPAAKKSCTWYHNTGNDEAKKVFNHVPLPWPILMPPAIAAEYEKRLAPIYTENENNILECALEHHFVAMGCDGQRHRGPSAFASFLAYAGCSPENANTIVNNVWGTNHVPRNTRKAIAARGYKLGSQNPEARGALQALMTSK